MRTSANIRIYFALFVITLFGAFLRINAASLTVIDNPIRADARIYYHAALNLKNWSVFSRSDPSSSAPRPDAFVQPGLPTMIGPLIDFPPTDRMILRINALQAFLGTLTILATFALFQTLTSPIIALGAATLAAISPHLIVMGTYLLTETLFTFLLTAGLAAMAIAWRKNNTLLALTAGSLLGLSALTRATTEYLPIFMLIGLFGLVDRRLFARVILPATLVSLAAILAWKLRNFSAIGAFSDPSLMISALHHGMYPDFMFNAVPASRGIPYRFDPMTGQFAGSIDVIREILRRGQEDPMLYLRWYLIGKPIALLSWEMVDGIGDIFLYPVLASPYFDKSLFIVTREIVYWLHAPLSIAAVIGGAVAVMRPQLLGLDVNTRFPAILLTAVMLYFFLIHLVGAPYPRYGIPLRPIVYGFGLFTIGSAVQCISQCIRFARK